MLESYSGDIQFSQFPTMTTTEEVVVKKKLKIKFATKRIEAEPQSQSCEFGQQTSLPDEWDHSTLVKESEKSGIYKPEKFVVHSNNKKIIASEHSKVKFSIPGCNKRGPPGVIEGQKDKRQKMDRSVTQQCSVILKTLMTHSAGWVFNKPVDPVALNIPDYFSIISEPMDLGTIKSKLGKNLYFGAEEFAADVRLTFSNAMLYNPPANDVHLMAKELNNIFDVRWKSIEAKQNCESSKAEQGQILSRRVKKADDTRQNCPKIPPLHATSLLNKRSMSSAEKQKLRKEVLEVSRRRMPPHLRSFLQRYGLICQNKENIEVDIEAFDDGILWELKRIIRNSFETQAPEVELTKRTQTCGGKSLEKNFHKGTDGGNRPACGSVNTKLPSSAVPSCKCGSCGSITCQCNLHNDSTGASSSDLSSEGSFSRDHSTYCGDASKPDCQAKDTSTSQISKSDPDSDGAVSAVDDENICHSSHLTTPAIAGTPEEGWKTPLIDVQLSPKRALRAAMLKRRFADTILKAQQKTLLDHGDKADLVKMQQEKERLERKQHEEKARIEAQIRAAEAASRMRADTELKMQRQREREAARIALQKMEKTVEIDENLKIQKDLEMLSGCSPSDHVLDSEDGSEVLLLGAFESGHFGNPLERLGLFMKDDYLGDDEDEEAILNGDGEEGEIFS